MSKEAMKLVLEALEAATRYGAGGFEDAKDALRVALAEQPAQQEPVAWVTGFHAGRCVIKALNPAAILPVGIALYTSPSAQRKPLTDEEIRDLWSWSMTAGAERTANTQQHAFARAIEAAHGIKENT